jgi:hypothetical protein
MLDFSYFILYNLWCFFLEFVVVIFVIKDQKLYCKHPMILCQSSSAFWLWIFGAMLQVLLLL